EHELARVRGRHGVERLLQTCRDAADEIPDRTERPRNREVVAGAEQHPGPCFELPREPGDERGLADPRLAGDEHHSTGALRSSVARLPERSQRLVTLEPLHRTTITP